VSKPTNGRTPIGELRHRIIIQTCTYNRNVYGEAVPNWTTSDTRWGKVEDLSGRELYRAKQVNSEVDVKVTFRYNSALTAKNRLMYGTRVLEIAAVLDPDGRKIETHALCVESPDAV
jgi:SPP1 family predicted phage head-tail adaptor